MSEIGTELSQERPVVAGSVRTAVFRVGRAAKAGAGGASPANGAGVPGRVPRVARLMALAIRLEGLLREGSVGSQAELAAVAHVTPARVTQILNLLHLAPELQEQLLHLPPVERGRDPVTERDLRRIAGVVDWDEQVRMWASTQRSRSPDGSFQVSLV